MVRIHYLPQSRSIRIVWLMEELGRPYEMVVHQRDPVTMRSPQSLRDLHPLGKAPVIEDDGTVIAETGAIIDYLLTVYDDGQLAPRRGDDDWAAYIELLHYAEGSAAFPIMVELIEKLLQQQLPHGLKQFFHAETVLQLNYISARIRPSGYLLDRGFSAADIQLAYMIEKAKDIGALDDYPKLLAYWERLIARPAYVRSAQRIGAAM